MAFKFGNSESEYKMDVKGHAEGININIGDTAIKAQVETAVQQVLRTAGQTASKVIESGGDIITAPATWLKDMQQNWLTYMIGLAIILSTITFLYCAVRSYLNRKNNNWSNNNLADLIKVVSDKKSTIQQPLSLSALDLPSIPPNLLT